MASKASKSWMPVDYKAYQVRCIQALARGDAPPEMQRDALDWIINSLAATYDMSYRPESDRDTTFAEGRRFVGLQLVKMLHLIPSKIEEK